MVAAPQFISPTIKESIYAAVIKPHAVRSAQFHAFVRVMMTKNWKSWRDDRDRRSAFAFCSTSCRLTIRRLSVACTKKRIGGSSMKPESAVYTTVDRPSRSVAANVIETTKPRFFLLSVFFSSVSVSPHRHLRCV